MKVSVRLREETEVLVRNLAQRQGGSLSAFVRAAIREKLDREEKKARALETRQASRRR